MNKIETGGPAFPCDPTTYTKAKGMTLRDYFAAKALTALISEWGRVMQHMEGKDFSGLSIIDNDGGTPTAITEEAYAMADAMLEARK